MNWCKALCQLSASRSHGSACLAQDITDVEAKPYGSYTGGAIDTGDLATGNLMLNIPLVSFPQLGSLPPLSFSVELNNAPYCRPRMRQGYVTRLARFILLVMCSIVSGSVPDTIHRLPAPSINILGWMLSHSSIMYRIPSTIPTVKTTLHHADTIICGGMRTTRHSRTQRTWGPI